MFGLSFGDYVEVYVGTTNASKDRSLACIALYPVGNSMGGWMFWNISTNRLLRRSNWIKMVTMELVIRAVNTIAVEEDADAESYGLIEDDVEVTEPPIVENVDIDMDKEEATQQEGNDEDVERK